MNHQLKTWIEFFRLPNLPSAAGDAIAGAAIASLATQISISWKTAVIAALCGVFLYMAGLADNDICDFLHDKKKSPSRPIPSGRISLSVARFVRLLCFLIPFGIAYRAQLPTCWFYVAATIVLTTLLYNRIKRRMIYIGAMLMGICRGLDLLAGAAAIGCFPQRQAVFAMIALPFICWTNYVVDLTLLSSDENLSLHPLSNRRFLPILYTIAPIATLIFLPGISIFEIHHASITNFRPWISCTVGCLIAALIWFVSVKPLGRRHTQHVCRKAARQIVAGLLFMQAGFAFASDQIPLMSVIVALLVIRVFFSALQQISEQ